MGRTGTYIKLDRGIRDSDLWDPKKCGPFSDGHAWVDMLLRANYKQRTIRVGRTRVTLEPGSFVTSTRNLADAWGWSVGKVRRFLHELVEDDRITWLTKTDRRAKQGYSMITICNWREYQLTLEALGSPNGSPTDHQTDRQRIANGIANGSPVVHRQERKELKEGEEVQLLPTELAMSLKADVPFEHGVDSLDEYAQRSTWSTREDLAERRVEAEGCLNLYNDMTGASMELTIKLLRMYVELWDLWHDPIKCLDAVKGLFAEPDTWSLKKGLGPAYVWRDAETAEKFVAFARDYWVSGGFDQTLEMKRRKRATR